MHRRSAVGTLAATLAGVSLGQVPDIGASAPPLGGPFSVTRASLAQSSGTVTCPVCQEMADSLELTPAGPCLRCADADPTLRVKPRSDRFWTLSPRQLGRLEGEIQRLAADLDRMNHRFASLAERQMLEGSDVYDRAMEAGRDEWHALQRELHLLHLLRAASRQFGGHRT